MHPTHDDDVIYWMIETATPEGEPLDIPFTGTRTEARREARLHPGSTLSTYAEWKNA
ncbi:hypothetical protein KHO57_gp027 [Mycobacterium phage Phabba]|uniref:Uncharacterized protein n=1 Tax=Mycobacterium phage Phabba TaxID=2027899 RepID=A0A249XS74_9CAUD|nr:hypothetical protein KHO57_gp027 [Mycobacterium phage Phabba]ASZ74602.1 hypothetical protein SEA_PHABBA_27 [Mycobacterium phage Phabba]